MDKQGGESNKCNRFILFNPSQNMGQYECSLNFRDMNTWIINFKSLWVGSKLKILDNYWSNAKLKKMITKVANKTQEVEQLCIDPDKFWCQPIELLSYL